MDDEERARLRDERMGESAVSLGDVVQAIEKTGRALWGRFERISEVGMSLERFRRAAFNAIHASLAFAGFDEDGLLENVQGIMVVREDLREWFAGAVEDRRRALEERESEFVQYYNGLDEERQREFAAFMRGIYTGYTRDIDRRLATHNAGHGGAYTRGRLPVRLAHAEPFDTQAQAMRREIELKRPTRRKKEALIAGGVDAPAGLVAVCLVACTKEKRPGTHPAARLYVSEWFRKASAFAARSASRWFVLSAKYGLLAPDRRVACYDQVLTRMTAAERREWAGRVLERLIPQVRAGDRVLVLAGLAYREHLLERLRRHACTVEVPMEGLGIGRQLQWLKRKEAGRGQDR